MILVLIILIFLIRVGIKIILIGISVSSYMYNRYKKIREYLDKKNGKVEQKPVGFKENAIEVAKITAKVTVKASKIVTSTVLRLLDFSLGILNKFLVSALGSVVVLDSILLVTIVSIMGYYITVFEDDSGNGLDMVFNTVHSVSSVVGGIPDGREDTPPTNNDDTGSGSGGVTDTGGGSSGSGGLVDTGSGGANVYDLLASDPLYKGKASALAEVYNRATASWGRDVAVGLMANVLAEGSPGKIEGINFKKAFDSGKINKKRKVVLSCNCSKKGTTTIDYWAKAPCSAHELAGSVISSSQNVSDMLSIPDGVGGIGVGSIQWSGGRRKGILQKYSQLSDFSESSLLMADVSYILEELSTSYSGVISDCIGKSASECAKIICNDYEAPVGGSNAANYRAGVASDLSSKLLSVGR